MDKELIISVMDRLKEIKEIRWIDLDEGQLNVGSSPSVAYPCILVDISYPNITTMSGGVQMVKALISLRVAFLAEGSTNAHAPKMVRDNGLKRYDILKEIHNHLQRWCVAGKFNPLRRVRSIPERRSDGVKVFNVVYETNFLD